MPPRKSNVSIVSNGPEEATESTPAKTPKDGISVEDLSLPKSMINRLSKGVLPPNTQIQRDALFALHKSATVFVNYLASNANESALAGGKRTIMPQDVQAALKDCELEEFLPRLKAELTKYNDIQCDKRNTYRKKVKEGKAAAAGDDSVAGQTEGETTGMEPGLDDTISTTNGHMDTEDGERPTKKFKGEDGTATAPDADDLEDEAMDDDNDALPDGGDTLDDLDDEEGGNEDEEEDDEEEDDGGAQLVDDDEPDDEDELPSASHIRDEALDEPASDSD